MDKGWLLVLFDSFCLSVSLSLSVYVFLYLSLCLCLSFHSILPLPYFISGFHGKPKNLEVVGTATLITKRFGKKPPSSELGMTYPLVFLSRSPFLGCRLYDPGPWLLIRTLWICNLKFRHKFKQRGAEATLCDFFKVWSLLEAK